MDLIDVINSIIQENTKAQKPTELAIGTVTSDSPLEIQINPNMPPLPEAVLLLCESVQEKEYEVEPTTAFTSALATKEITCPSVIGTIQRDALTVGEKVIMLRVLKGQQYIVLSRI